MLIAHAERVAKRRVNGGEGWEGFSYEAVEGGVIIKGGIPTIIQRGPRKGRKQWPGPNQTTIVSEDEVKAEGTRYEIETGNCSTCLGEGRVMKSWSATEGTTYRPCHKCNGSGKAEGFALAAERRATVIRDAVTAYLAQAGKERI